MLENKDDVVQMKETYTFFTFDSWFLLTLQISTPYNATDKVERYI